MDDDELVDNDEVDDEVELDDLFVVIHISLNEKLMIYVYENDEIDEVIKADIIEKIDVILVLMR